MKRPYPSPVHRQRGAVAIEFVVLFPLFLLMLYAIISYSVIMATQQALHSLSSEAARAAVAANFNDENIENNLKLIIDERKNASWTSGWISTCNGFDEYFRLTQGTEGDRDKLDVCFQVTIGPGESLALPRLPLIVGSIPSENLTEIASRASIRL